MMFNQRTNPLYIKAKEIIDSGRLGKLTRIVWIITNWYRPRAYYAQGGWRGTWWGEGGGVLLNQCPHQLDLFTWLAGLPVSVTATASTVGRDISVENDVTAYCKFANGATGVFITSTHDAPGTNRLEITGEGGKIVIENGKLVFTENEEMEPAFRNITPCLWASRKQKIQVSRNRALSCRHEISASARRHNQNYTDYLLKKTDKFTAPGEQGIVGLTFSNAIHLASWTHKEVRIPFDEDLYISELEKRKEAEKENGKNNQNTQKGSYYERYFKRRTGDGTKFHFAHERTQKQGLYRVRDGRYGVLSRFRAGHVVLAKILHRHFQFKPVVHHAYVHRRESLGRN